MTIFLKQSTASQEIPLGYFVDSTDGDTEETALTINNTDIKIWKTGATTLANKNSGGGTHISNGVYYATLDATDTNTLGPMVIFVHVSGALTVRLECCVLAANIYDSLIGGGDTLQTDVTQWLGTAAATPTTAGVPEVDITHISGSAVSTTTAQIGANVVQVSGDATAADNLELDYDGTGYTKTNSTVGTVTTLTGHTAQTGDNYARLGAPAGASVSADIAAVQTTADAVEVDTQDIQGRIPSTLTTGTADSGTTTTMVDAALTQADTDYWAGNWIRFTSGTISGQTRLITGFTPASDTVTFAPATTQSVGTNTYEILPAGGVDVQEWASATVNALVSGAVDANVGQISGDATAADNLEADYDGTGYNKSASTIGTCTTNTDMITTAQVNAEVVDVMKTDTISEMAQQAPPATPTFEEAVMYVYMSLRNKIDVTSSLKEFHNDAGTVIWKKSLSDDGTTYSEAEGVTGP